MDYSFLYRICKSQNLSVLNYFYHSLDFKGSPNWSLFQASLALFLHHVFSLKSVLIFLSKDQICVPYLRYLYKIHLLWKKLAKASSFKETDAFRFLEWWLMGQSTIEQLEWGEERLSPAAGGRRWQCLAFQHFLTSVLTGTALVPWLMPQNSWSSYSTHYSFCLPSFLHTRLLPPLCLGLNFLFSLVLHYSCSPLLHIRSLFYVQVLILCSY